MVVKQNDEVKAETEAEKTAKPSSANLGVTMVGTACEPRFRPKTGSVFPARRRLVKSLMLQYVLRQFGSSSSAISHERPADDHRKTGHSTRPKKEDSHVYPYP